MKITTKNASNSPVTFVSHFRRPLLPAVLLRKLSNRDLTIRQPRRPWKHRWKIDFASFKLFRDYPNSPCCLKDREFWLELKRGDRTRVQTEMVIFIALVISRRSCAGTYIKERDARAELLFCSLNLLLFWRSHCRRRRSFVRFLLMSSGVTWEIRKSYIFKTENAITLKTCTEVYFQEIFH